MKDLPDLHIIEDPLAWLIKNRDRFLWQKDHGLQLAMNLAGDILILTNGPVTVFRNGDWWLIGGREDWLGYEDDNGQIEVFGRVLPFPEAGPNSIRSESLLAAFALDLLTFSNDKVKIVKGTMNGLEVSTLKQMDKAEFKQVVAFRMNITPE